MYFNHETATTTPCCLQPPPPETSRGEKGLAKQKKAKMFQQEDEEQHEQDAQDALQLAADLAEASLCENVSLIFSHFESQFISFLSFFFQTGVPTNGTQDYGE